MLAAGIGKAGEYDKADYCIKKFEDLLDFLK